MAQLPGCTTLKAARFPQDDHDRLAVLDRCASACLRFAAGLDEGARRAPKSLGSGLGSPDTPRSVLPLRSAVSFPCWPASPPEALRAALAAARAWGAGGDRGPAEAACSADAAWFRQRLAANCMV